MKAVDTSVVIASFASWHESHHRALEVVATRPALPGPSARGVRGPDTTAAPHRAPAEVVRDYLAANFATSWLTLSGSTMRSVLDELTTRGITGGATYDAIIAATAREVGATLVTCDVRARVTYERMGVVAEYLV
ncbi:MAG: hypothetical protein LH650_04950 [Chloroflexi bacterium]|nr:hypothetical protein [Chloroflexota bacterium]